MYEEPIDNPWTDIRKEFDKLREAAQWASYEFATVHGYLCEIQESRDPEQAFAVIQKLEGESGKSVEIPDELLTMRCWLPFDLIRSDSSNSLRLVCSAPTLQCGERSSNE